MDTNDEAEIGITLNAAAQTIKELRTKLGQCAVSEETLREQLSEAQNELMEANAALQYGRDAIQAAVDGENTARAQLAEAQKEIERLRTFDVANLTAQVDQLTRSRDYFQREVTTTQTRLSEWMAPYDQAKADFLRRSCEALGKTDLSPQQVYYEIEQLRSQPSQAERNRQALAKLIGLVDAYNGSSNSIQRLFDFVAQYRASEPAAAVPSEGKEKAPRRFETIIGNSFDERDEWGEHEAVDARAVAIAVKEYYEPDCDSLVVWVRELGSDKLPERWLVMRYDSHEAEPYPPRDAAGAEILAAHRACTCEPGPVTFSSVCDPCKDSLPAGLWQKFVASELPQRREAGQEIERILKERATHRDTKTERP